MCCEQGRPVMARQKATMLYLSATQSTSYVMPDMHAEHLRTISLVPSITL